MFLALFSIFLNSNLVLPIESVEINKNILYAVKEETEIGAFIGNLLIDSNLIKVNDKSIFKMYDEGKSPKYFTLESDTGKLSVAQRIDREQICPTSFTAQDRCQIELTVFVPSDIWITIIVTVQDINDHEPKFTEQFYQIQISEAVQIGYRISLRTASDPDVEPNNVCGYYMNGHNDTFTIMFSNLLYLIVNKTLDYETQTNYKTVLMACDCGTPSRCGNQTLDISILDVNDNKPIFSQKEYKVTIREDTLVGEVVSNVTATDADSGIFGQVRYQFGQIQDSSLLTYFYISTYTGEIKLQRLLNCKHIAQDFSLNVEAYDGGNVPKVGYATVYIHLIDVNNQRPVININSLGRDKKEFSVKENQTAMSYFAIIWVSDGDIGVNAEVECKLTVGEDNFKLTSSRSVKGRDIYTLQPKRIFDREKESHYQARIFCSDKGTPRLTTEEDITVKILDVNEFPPKFKREKYYVEVPENGTNGMLLTQLQATDEDATAQLIYEIAANGDNSFIIDPVLGYLRTAKNLDREKEDKISIVVLAIDPGEPRVRTASTTVYIKLLDTNDNPPQLINRPNLEVHENEKDLPKFLGRLEAKDPDLKENGTVRFYIQNVIGKSISFMYSSESYAENHTKILSIDEVSGNITLLSSLDRERINQYTVFVMLQDQGNPKLSSVEALVLNVLDVNDNPPKWVHPTIESSMINTSSVLVKDQRILIAQAIDPDSPNQGNITYRIVEGDRHVYINPYSGELKTLLSLGEGEYYIKLLASDNGDPNLSTEIQIKLFVKSRPSLSTIINFSDDQFRTVIVVTMVAMGGIILLGLFIFLFIMKRRSSKDQNDRTKFKTLESGIRYNENSINAADTRWADVAYSPVGSMWCGTANMHFNPTNYSMHDMKSETSKIFCNNDTIDCSSTNYAITGGRSMYKNNDMSTMSFHDPLLSHPDESSNFVSSKGQIHPKDISSNPTMFYTHNPKLHTRTFPSDTYTAPSNAGCLFSISQFYPSSDATLKLNDDHQTNYLSSSLQKSENNFKTTKI